MIWNINRNVCKAFPWVHSRLESAIAQAYKKKYRKTWSYSNRRFYNSNIKGNISKILLHKIRDKKFCVLQINNENKRKSSGLKVWTFVELKKVNAVFCKWITEATYRMWLGFTLYSNLVDISDINKELYFSFKTF